MSPHHLLYSSVLLKLSGEALQDYGRMGISHTACQLLAEQIKPIHSKGLRLGIVTGGGNLWRGLRKEGRNFERSASDHIGMLATLMNAIALQQALKEQGIKAHILNHLAPHPLSELYSQVRANELFDQQSVVIFAGGTGHPFFTTDTAAALMALQMRAEVLLKATQVDGIFDRDPKIFSDAKKLNCTTFQRVLSQRLNVLDQAAFALCQENRLAIRIFSNGQPGWLLRALTDENFGSLIAETDPQPPASTIDQQHLK